MIACLALGATQTFGAALAPGSVIIAPASGEPDPVGATLVTSLSVPFSVPGSFTGTLLSEVYSGGNPLGGLTFVYTVSNDAGSANSIGRLTVGDFDAAITLTGVDGSYQTPAAGVAPASIDRNVSGDVVGFNFVPIGAPTGFLAPGTTSAKLVIQTGAPAYVGSFGNLIDGGVTTVATLGPAVPEPATIALALASVASLGVYALRRR
jgi:hypothetical protein